MTFNSAVAQSRHGACVVLLCLSALFSSQTPAADTPPARARTEPQPYSVSAVAYAGLPERLASRARKGDVNTGPSAQELRGIFLQAVDTAIMRSPKVKGSKAQQQASRSDIDEARGQRWPQVVLGSQTRALQFGKSSQDEQVGGGINLSITTMVYDWGRLDNTIASRKQLAVAADEGSVAQMESTGYEVVSTLIELGKQRVISDLGQQFVNRMQDLEKMLAGIVAVDHGRASELTQARARLMQARALRDMADARARDAQISLFKLVGEREIPIPRSKEWNISLTQMEQLLSDAQNHPTIIQATAQAESAELQAKVVHASGLPQLNWVISKSTNQDSFGREQPWQTTLNMTWSVFSGGSNRAAERAALYRADASRQETEQQRLDLEFRIRTADHDARSQLERAELYRDLSVESDLIREEFFLQWHELGKRSLLDVLIAETDHYNNQVNEISNRFDGYQSIVQEYASAGVLARWLQEGH